MRALDRFLEKAFPIGFILLALGVAVYVGSCALRQKTECPAFPDSERLKARINNVIDEEFSK